MGNFYFPFRDLHWDLNCDIMFANHKTKGEIAVEQTDVIRFFDGHAARWDAEMICDDRCVNAILDASRIAAGADVLDIACGTGVMFPFYMARNVASVTAIDISPAMVKIAQSKTAGLPIRVVCGDAAVYDFGRQFDAAVIYNAFPHFPDSGAIIAALARWVKPGGTLTVAHGMSRQDIHRHHEGSAAHVSIELPPAQELSALFAPYFEVTTAVDNETMYQVTGIRRNLLCV